MALSRSSNRAHLAFLSSLAVVLAALTLLLGNPSRASAQTFFEGNPDCVGLGFAAGFKIAPDSGTYPVPGAGTITVVVTGSTFDFTSTFGIDAVIVKGGPNANVYFYDPETFAGVGLHAPINPNNNQPFGLSHIEFCYDIEAPTETPTEVAVTEVPTETPTETPPVGGEEETPIPTDTPAAGVTETTVAGEEETPVATAPVEQLPATGASPGGKGTTGMLGALVLAMILAGVGWLVRLQSKHAKR